MPRHLIDIKTTDVIKAVAILIVVLGHYARFKEDPVPLVSHLPFFGAALFAFMSGYGTAVSYIDKKSKMRDLRTNWGWWISSRIRRVYFPFLFINIVSLPLYERGNFWGQIFLGFNDEVMWYPIFILVFYIVFALSMQCGKGNGNEVLMVCFAVVTYIVLAILEVSSQWYTSIPALLYGFMLAIHEDWFEKKIRGKIVIALVCIFFLIGLIVISTRTNGVIKYGATGFAGVLFSAIVFISVRECCIRWMIIRRIAIIGSYSYFAYLTHMKIFDVLENSIGTKGLVSFLLFAICTIFFTITTQRIWNSIDIKISELRL